MYSYRHSFALLFGLLLFSWTGNSQTHIGFSAYAPGYIDDLPINRYYESDINFLNIYLQGKLASRLDYKLTGGIIYTGNNRYYYQLSFPIYLTHDRNENGFGQGFYVEPTLSSGRYLNRCYGGGLGLGYQYNYGILTAHAGVRGLYERSFSPYYFVDGYVGEIYLGVGFQLPRLSKKVYTAEEDSLRRTRFWATASIGNDDEYNAYSGHIATSLKGAEWVSFGVEYIRTSTNRYRHYNDGTSQVSTIPIHALLFRTDFRIVQAFNPGSRWDPFLGLGAGTLWTTDDNYGQIIPSLSAGLRYWVTDHIGVHVEGGVLMKNGFHAGLSYRL